MALYSAFTPGDCPWLVVVPYSRCKFLEQHIWAGDWGRGQRGISLLPHFCLALACLPCSPSSRSCSDLSLAKEDLTGAL